MTTASELFDAVMKEIIVGAAESPADASDAADFIYTANNYMQAQVAMGLDVSWTALTGLTDTVTITKTIDSVVTDVSAGFIEPLTKILAIRCAPQFGAPVSPELREQAKEGQEVIDYIGSADITMAYPETLPAGGGNVDGRYEYEDDFYPGAS